MTELALQWIVYWGWTLIVVLAATGLASQYATGHGRRLRLWLVRGCAWVIGSIGVLAWAGHILDRPAWYSLAFDMTPMAPNTAMSLVLVSIALLLIAAVIHDDTPT